MLGLCSIYPAHAALVDGLVLDFFPATPVDGTTEPTSGSWFSQQISIDTTLYIPISSHDGIILGSAQPGGGSHSLLPDGTENLSISEPWLRSGNTGLHYSISPISVLSASGNTATLDMSGIAFGWSGIENILMNDPVNFPGDTGIATVTCAVDCSIGDTYELDYSGHIPLDSPSGFGGVLHGLHLEGTITAVPIPTALWLFGSGLLGLIGVARKAG